MALPLFKHFHVAGSYCPPQSVALALAFRFRRRSGKKLKTDGFYVGSGLEKVRKVGMIKVLELGHVPDSLRVHEITSENSWKKHRETVGKKRRKKSETARINLNYPGEGKKRQNDRIT